MEWIELTHRRPEQGRDVEYLDTCWRYVYDEKRERQLQRQADGRFKVDTEYLEDYPPTPEPIDVDEATNRFKNELAIRSHGRHNWEPITDDQTAYTRWAESFILPKIKRRKRG